MNLHDMPEAGPKQLREFGLILAGGLVLFFGLLIPWIWGFAHWPRWPFIAAAVFTVLALAAPVVLKPLYKFWMALGAVLGFINTRIILGIAFFLVFLPVGLILKILGKDPMARRLESATQSYRVESRKAPREHLEKPF
ncbi:MAG: SxtJ family membrane protein [Gammaproteobacteria bacterium]